MGLRTSHGCWHGAYSAFDAWRRELAKAASGPLHELLRRSNCDGEIPAEQCQGLADELEAMLPRIPEVDPTGHVYNWRKATETFITGLRLAAQKNEPVAFR